MKFTTTICFFIYQGPRFVLFQSNEVDTAVSSFLAIAKCLMLQHHLGTYCEVILHSLLDQYVWASISEAQGSRKLLISDEA